MDIKEIASHIHNINIQNGFWPQNKKERNKPELLMLIVSELAEALEALRENHYTSLSKEELDSFYKSHGKLSIDEFKQFFSTHIKNSFEDEIADSIIRLLDLTEGLGIDIEKHIVLKASYNSLRGPKHGKEF